MMLFIMLILISLALYVSFKCEVKSLKIGSRVAASGTKSLGKEDDPFIECPQCTKKVRRTQNVYCSSCNIYF